MTTTVTNVVPAVTLLVVAAIFAAPAWLLAPMGLWVVGELICVIFANPPQEPPLSRHRRDTYTESGPR